MRIRNLHLQVALQVGDPVTDRPEHPDAPLRETPANLPPGVLAEIAAGLTGGQPLPPDVQAWARATFGADLSQVRVHADPRARRLNEAAGTAGLAVGDRTILLRTPTDQATLRHEAVHMAQAIRGSKASRPEREQAATAAEVFARQYEPGLPPEIDIRALADQVYALLADQLRRDAGRRP